MKGVVSAVWIWTRVLQLLKELYLVSGIHGGHPRLALFLIHSGLQQLYRLFILTWPKIITKWNDSELIISHKRTTFLKVNTQGKENGVMENNSKITPNVRWCELENSDLSQSRSNSSWMQAYWHWNELGKKKILSNHFFFQNAHPERWTSYHLSLMTFAGYVRTRPASPPPWWGRWDASHGPPVSAGLFTTIPEGPDRRDEVATVRWWSCSGSVTFMKLFEVGSKKSNRRILLEYFRGMICYFLTINNIQNWCL